jgi:hypothetical protein
MKQRQERKAMDDQKKQKPDAKAAKEFTGRIDRITAGSQFSFDMKTKKSGQKSFFIPLDNAGMAALVIASYVSGKKISIKSKSDGGAGDIASEIRLGAKSEDAKSDIYPKKLKAAPSQPPAGVIPPA